MVHQFFQSGTRVPCYALSDLRCRCWRRCATTTPRRTMMPPALPPSLHGLLLSLYLDLFLHTPFFVPPMVARSTSRDCEHTSERIEPFLVLTAEVQVRVGLEGCHVRHCSTDMLVVQRWSEAEPARPEHTLVVLEGVLEKTPLSP